MSSLSQQFADLATARGLHAVVRTGGGEVRPALVGPTRPLIYGRVGCTSPTCRCGWDYTSARDCGVCHGAGFVSRRVWPQEHVVTVPA